MISVQNNELTFHNTNFSYMEMAGQIWLTASEVGQALSYADDKAVQRIYTRHADEFTDKMTGVVKLTTLVECRILAFFHSVEPTSSRCLPERQRLKNSAAGYWIFWIVRFSTHRSLSNLPIRSYVIWLGYGVPGLS